MKDIQDKILSLAQASALTGYHQDYLGYLCRTKKLDGQKVGRNWITTEGAVKILMGEQIEEPVSLGEIPVRVVTQKVSSPNRTWPEVSAPNIFTFTSIEVMDLPIRLRALSTTSNPNLIHHGEIAVTSHTINSLRSQVASLTHEVEMLRATLANRTVNNENNFSSPPFHFHSQKFMATLPLIPHQSVEYNIPSVSLLSSIDENKIRKSFFFARPRFQFAAIFVLALVALSGSAFLTNAKLFGSDYSTYTWYDKNSNQLDNVSEVQKLGVSIDSNNDQQGEVLGVTTISEDSVIPITSNQQSMSESDSQSSALTTNMATGLFLPVDFGEASLEKSIMAVNGNTAVTGNLEVLGGFTGAIAESFVPTGNEVTGATAGQVLFTKSLSEINKSSASSLWDGDREDFRIGSSLASSVNSLSNNTASGQIITVKSSLNISRNSVGQAKIIRGHTSARIQFESLYASQPVVVVTPTEFIDGAYRVTEITSGGFIIELEKRQSIDINFNWYSFPKTLSL